MSAMMRRLFNVLAAVSLVLCMAMMAAWARSYWVAHAVYSTARSRQFVVVLDISRGQVMLGPTWIVSGPDTLGSTAGLHHDAMLPHDNNHLLAGHVDIYWHWQSFFVQAVRARQNVVGPSVVREVFLAVPAWFSVLVLTLPPAVWLKRRLNA